jgi:hypothetical protein
MGPKPAQQLKERSSSFLVAPGVLEHRLTSLEGIITLQLSTATTSSELFRPLYNQYGIMSQIIYSTH